MVCEEKGNGGDDGRVVLGVWACEEREVVVVVEVVMVVVMAVVKYRDGPSANVNTSLLSPVQDTRAASDRIHLKSSAYAR